MVIKYDIIPIVLDSPKNIDSFFQWVMGDFTVPIFIFPYMF